MLKKFTALLNIPRLQRLLDTLCKAIGIPSTLKLKSFEQLEVFPQTLMNAIPNPIFYKDVQGIYQGCNKAFADFIGMPQEKIIGCSVYDLSPCDLARKYEAMDGELFNNPQVQI